MQGTKKTKHNKFTTIIIKTYKKNKNIIKKLLKLKFIITTNILKIHSYQLKLNVKLITMQSRIKLSKLQVNIKLIQHGNWLEKMLNITKIFIIMQLKL